MTIRKIQLKKKSTLSGFTLIELLVVISILGVLASLLMVNISGIRERVRDARRKSDLKEIKAALRIYHNDGDDYPATDALPFGDEFSDASGTTVYMNQVPNDPLNNDDYQYYYRRAGQDDFLLRATLENSSDSDIQSSRTVCQGTIAEGDISSENDYFVCSD